MFKKLLNWLVGEKYGGGFHKPDKRDHKADHVIGGIPDIVPCPSPESVLMMTLADNQLQTAHCSTYATYHAAKIANELEHKIQIHDLPERGWALQTAFGTSTPEGDCIQSALKSIIKNGLQTDNMIYPIVGYASEDLTIEKMKLRLIQGYPLIVLGPVTHTNFVSARDTGIWTGLDGTQITAHFFCINGYDKDGFTALNSYGNTWGHFGNGTFKVPYAKISDLQCCYLLYDKKDVNFLYSDVSDQSWAYEAIKWCKDNGLMHGYSDNSFRPDQPVTRAELATVLFNKFKNAQP